LTRLFKNKSEALQVLKVNNENAKSVMKNITNIKPKHYMYHSVLILIQELEKLQINRIRDLTFNAIMDKDGKNIAIALDKINGFSKTSKTSFTNTASGTNVFSPNNAGQAIQSPSHAFFFGGDLPAVYEPFLPPVEGEGVYSLVLDLDETLVHYFDMGPDSHFLIRPGCNKFLTELSKYYELVIFTAAMQDYADSVLDQIDKEGLIKYRLYRQHTSPHGSLIAKDLSRIGRDLSRSILVDNVADNFALQPDNGIFITTWYDDMSDTCLYDLIPLLKSLVKNKVKDVRISLRSYRDQVLRHIVAGVKDPHKLIK